MRSVKLLFAVFLLCGAALAQGVAGDPETGDFQLTASFLASVVDGTPCGGHNSASPATCSAAMTPTAAGDSVNCVIQQFSFGTVGGYVSDSVNGPYDAVFQDYYDSSNGHWESGFRLDNISASAITPTAVTQGSTSGLSIACILFKGTATSFALDPGWVQFNPPTSAGNVGITGANPTTGTAQTPTNAKEAKFCGMSNVGPTTPAAGSGFSTLGTGQLAGAELWPEWKIDTTAVADNGPYTAASDTWVDGCMGNMNAGAASGGVRAWSGHFTDGHGIANNTAVSAANLQSGGYSSVANVNSVGSPSWTCANISTAKWITGSGLPNRLTNIFVNGNYVAGNTGLAIQHTGTLTTEACTDQLLVNQTGFAEQDFTISQAGYTPSPTGDLCDIASIAGSASAGDDVTPQFVYAVGVLTAAGNASGGSTVYTAAGTTLTLTSVATATTGSTNNGQAVYTGTITGGGSNALQGEQFLVTGFTNSANNGTYIAVLSTTTTLTLLNANAVAETHAATAVTRKLWDRQSRARQQPAEWRVDRHHRIYECGEQWNLYHQPQRRLRSPSIIPEDSRRSRRTRARRRWASCFAWRSPTPRPLIPRREWC